MRFFLLFSFYLECGSVSTFPGLGERYFSPSRWAGAIGQAYEKAGRVAPAVPSKLGWVPRHC